MLCVVKNRLRIVETKAMACCVMTGSVTESFLIASAEAGPPHSPYGIHKITIAPFEQDFRRDTAAWGQLFEFLVISGMISSCGFGFTTRGEGKGENWRSRGCSLFVRKITRLTSVVSVCSNISCQGQIERIEDGLVFACRCFFGGSFACL